MPVCCREREAGGGYTAWRERLHRGAAVYPVEVDGTTFDLMERFGGLNDSKTGDRQAVATGLGRLLRRAVGGLLGEEAGSRRWRRRVGLITGLVGSGVGVWRSCSAG